MKARSRAMLEIRPVQDEVTVRCESFSIGRYNVPIWLCKLRIVINSGSELARV